MSLIFPIRKALGPLPKIAEKIPAFSAQNKDQQGVNLLELDEGESCAGPGGPACCVGEVLSCAGPGGPACLVGEVLMDWS